MVLNREPGRPGCVVEGAVQTVLQLLARDEVLHPPAADADEMVVVTGQILGELEVAVLVAGDDPVHDAGVDQLGEVAIGAALSEAVGLPQQLGDRQGPVGCRQDADHQSP